MTPTKLTKILKPLGPCSYGVKLARQFKTIKGWWKSKRVPDNHRLWLWFVVAAADRDNVFFRELRDFVLKGERDLKRRRRFLDKKFRHMRRVRRLWPHPQVLLFGSVTPMTDIFRCPTEAELNKIQTWLNYRPIQDFSE